MNNLEKLQKIIQEAVTEVRDRGLMSECAVLRNGKKIKLYNKITLEIVLLAIEKSIYVSMSLQEHQKYVSAMNTLCDRMYVTPEGGVNTTAMSWILGQTLKYQSQETIDFLLETLN